jgi:hypothetical protein
MNKVRNAYSPAGMGYSLYGTMLVNLKDCPVCRFGTLDKKTITLTDGKECTVWKCADCGRVFAEKVIQL